jgi:hypothetical protein
MSKVSEGSSRRELLKRAAYVAPVIVTFPILPAAANSGSERHDPTTGPE